MEKWYCSALHSITGIGNERMRSLIAYFGSARKVWEASRDDLSASGCLSPALGETIDAARRSLAVEEMANSMEKKGIDVCLLTDGKYPRLLRHVSRPPLLFYYYGSLPEDERVLAIVGTRKASRYGCSAATLLSEKLAQQGFWIVSGAARGIDAAAHRGALRQGRTLAVLGCSIDKVYPAEHRNLLKQIVDGGGGVISEYAPDTPTYRGNFPARNRIISGISRGVIVVEAGERSGALITADFALEEGRDVFAVPGSIFSSVSYGAHKLIAQGAKLVHSPEDVLQEYETVTAMQQPENKVVLQGVEEEIYEVIAAESAITLEEIIMQTGYKASEVSYILLLLELRGHVSVQEGKRYIRTPREVSR